MYCNLLKHFKLIYCYLKSKWFSIYFHISGQEVYKMYNCALSLKLREERRLNLGKGKTQKQILTMSTIDSLLFFWYRDSNLNHSHYRSNSGNLGYQVRVSEPRSSIYGRHSRGLSLSSLVSGNSFHQNTSCSNLHLILSSYHSWLWK